MTSKFSIDNRELLQRISSGEAVVGINFGNLIVRELAAFRLAAMDSEPVAYIFKHPAGRLSWSLTDESNKGHDYVMPVYAAPQSPGSEPATVPGKWITVSEQKPDCWCLTCRPVTLNDMRFVVCPDCGNKRCPRANDHRDACTGSNEPGQEGSVYPAAQQEVKGE
ncbi:hypothetical protein NUBL9661_17210 [Klebsiella pneumoniae]|nr:hypothetical protein NUBL9661_17210 [Klebsiella pneumoniae]